MLILRSMAQYRIEINVFRKSTKTALITNDQFLKCITYTILYIMPIYCQSINDTKSITSLYKVLTEYFRQIQVGLTNENQVPLFATCLAIFLLCSQ